MKKPFKHTERDSEVLCDNPNCAEINGIEGVVRQPIKKNVIARAPEGTDKFLCYYCGLAANSSNAPIRTKKEVKDSRAKSKQSRRATEPQIMTTETT